jgi:L-alanine-DL-glutamate epimerase-like enolase superfamily enzyme
MTSSTPFSSPVTIDERHLTETTLRAQDPNWRFALGARPTSRGLVVELVSRDGVRGYGWVHEAQHLGHDLDAVRSATEKLLQSLDEVRMDSLNVLLTRLEHLAGDSRPALAGVESAVLDLVARTQGVGVHALLGGAFRQQLPVMRILALKSPEDTAANAVKVAGEGYRYLKIKLDNESRELDADRVRAVRDAVGPDIHLTLDANQSYDAVDAIKLYESISDQVIDIFEQPVPARDLAGLKQVSDAIDCIVEADEAADSLKNILALAGTQSCTGISLKLPKLGGIRAVQQAARVCSDAGIRCRLGAHVGTQLLVAAALQAAVSISNIDYACELAEFVRLDDDPFGGLMVEDGAITLGAAPGLGVTPLAAAGTAG